MKSLRKFSYFNAKSIEEAVSTLAKYNGKAWPMAGGTDLLTVLRFQPLPEELYPEALVNLKTITPSLEYIREEEETLKIGSLTRLEDIAENFKVNQEYTALAEACGKVGSPHLREMGTIGGNISQLNRCWYFRKEDNRFYCLRKGKGGKAWAMMGDNRYHSIFGCAKICGAEPCVNGCPDKIDIPNYMKAIKKGDLDEAATQLLRFNPMPSVTGRVCPHLCEEECSRNVLDEPVAVRDVERFIGDYIIENADKFFKPPKESSGKRVSIVGSGPAGLSAAYYLTMLGYNVSIFEKKEKTGGLLRYGIPPFRLPKDVVEKIVETFKKLLKVEFKVKVNVGEDLTLEELMAKFDAVYLASGAWKEGSMRIPGEEHMESGLEFLEKINAGIRKAPGERVAVIGGGNVAIDVARVLLRLGAEPTILYRRTQDEMPALKEEVQVARDEGVKFEFLTQPIGVEKKDKILLKCVRMKLGPLDSTGRPVPMPIEGSEFTVEYDAVIKAVGENPDLSYVPREFLDERGKLKLDPSTYRVAKNLFAGGDAATGPKTVIEAIAAGREATTSIDKYLRAVERIAEADVEKTTFEKVDAAYLKKTGRVVTPEISITDRLTSMDVEDILGLSESEVKDEANRCLNCGCVMAHPSDVAPALIALNAKIVTTRRTIPADEFFKADAFKTTILDADEIIIEIQIPKPKTGTKSKFMKFTLRSSIDFPIVNCATAIESRGDIVKDAKICLNAVAPIPYRATKAEEYLKGKQITEHTAEEASGKGVEDANALPYNTYKIQIAKALIKRTILACK